MSEPDVDRDLVLLGGLAVQSRRPTDAEVVGVVRAGVERVVQPSMGIDLTWGTFAAWPGDDLGPGRSDTARSSLDWEFVAAKAQQAPLESLSVGAQSTAMKEAFDANPDFDVYDPHVDVAQVAVDLPPTVAPVGGVTMAVQMSTWALRAGSASDPTALVSWLLESADALDVNSGFVVLGRPPTGGALTSPYEAWAGTLVTERDLTRHVWGYGWGTLLSAGHVAALGGVARLRAVGDVTPVGRGRSWVTIGADPAAVDLPALARLRAVLAPVLAGPGALPPDTDPGPDWYLP